MIFDRPLIEEGSAILNATVPAGTADPSSPSVGELFYRTDLAQLRAYTGSVWVEAGNAGLTQHIADAAVHLTTAQNTLLDGLVGTLTAVELNFMDGVTSKVQTQFNTLTTNLSTHQADSAVHLSTAQNTLLDGLSPVLLASEINQLVGISDSVQGQINAVVAINNTQNSRLSTLETSGVPTVQANLDSHAADASLHLSTAQNTLLDSIQSGGIVAADILKLSGASGLTSSIKVTLDNLEANKLARSGAQAMLGNLSLGGYKITNLGMPTAPTDAASKDYVDSFVQGLHWVGSVEVGSVGNITSLYGLQSIDGITLTAGQRVLVKNQIDKSQNGIYIASATAWTRSSDYNTALEMSSSAVFVLGGVSQQRSTWVQAKTVSVVGTDPLDFTPFSGPVVNIAGDGIWLGVNGTVSVINGAGISLSAANELIVDVQPAGGLMLTTDGSSEATSITSNARVGLKPTGISAGTYNSSATKNRPFVIDTYGRVTSAGTEVTITPAWSSITNTPTTVAGFGLTDAVVKTGDTMSGSLLFTSGAKIMNVAPASLNAWFTTGAYGTGQGDNKTHFGYLNGSGVYVNYIRGEKTYLTADLDVGGTLTVKGYAAWHEGNDGSGSGLDADLVHGLNLSQGGARFNALPFIAADGITEIGSGIDFHTTTADSGDYAARISCSPINHGTLRLHGSSGGYQGIQFGSTAGNITLLSNNTTNETGFFNETSAQWQTLYTPSSSSFSIFDGTAMRAVWHAGNLTKLSQLTNDSGYITTTNANVNFVNVTGDTMSGALSVAHGGVGADPYGTVAVTMPTTSNYSYFGMTRSGQIGWNMGIQTDNRWFLGTGTAGAGSNVTSRVLSVGAAGDLTSSSSLSAATSISAGAGKFVVSSGGTISTLSGYSPTNGAIRLTPNLHLNAGAGNAVIINWDNGNGGSAGNAALRVATGSAADSFTVSYGGNVWAAGAATIVGSMTVGSILNNGNSSTSGHTTSSGGFSTNATGGGQVALYSGGPNNAGHVAFRNAAGTRVGYIGDQTLAGNGGNMYFANENVSGGFAFNRTVTAPTFAGWLSGTADAALRIYHGANSGNAAMAFNWAGQGGQPTWLWGGNDVNNMYVWNPSNFSVNYANTAGNSSNTSSISNAAGGDYTWSGFIRFRSNNNTAGGANFPLQAYSDNSSGACMSFHRAGQYAINMGLDSDNVFRIGGWSAGANRLQLDMSGNLTVAGDITAFSDIRKKKDIVTIYNALDKVERLNGVTFTRIEDEKRSTGLIAQDVQKVLPEAVLEDAEGTLSVAYGNMVGLLVESIKELNTKLAAMAAELQALKDNQ